MDKQGYGGYARAAAEINVMCQPRSPVSRQQVYEWHVRGTRNAAGTPFPDRVDGVFPLAGVVAWYRAGLSPMSVAQLSIWREIKGEAA